MLLTFFCFSFVLGDAATSTNSAATTTASSTLPACRYDPWFGIPPRRPHFPCTDINGATHQALQPRITATATTCKGDECAPPVSLATALEARGWWDNLWKKPPRDYVKCTLRGINQDMRCLWWEDLKDVCYCQSETSPGEMVFLPDKETCFRNQGW